MLTRCNRTDRFLKTALGSLVGIGLLLGGEVAASPGSTEPPGPSAIAYSAESENDLDAFYRALTDGRTAEVERLLRAHPEWLESELYEGIGPLYRAAVLDRVEVVTLLLDRGADVDRSTDRGSRPLHAAAHRGSSTAVKLMLAKGANPNVIDGDGYTPLFRAVLSNSLPCVRLLLGDGGDPNIPNARGRYPLHEAALAGHLEVVRELVDAGADLHSLDTKGATPLDLAERSSRNEAAETSEFLLGVGASRALPPERDPADEDPADEGGAEEAVAPEPDGSPGELGDPEEESSGRSGVE